MRKTYVYIGLNTDEKMKQDMYLLKYFCRMKGISGQIVLTEKYDRSNTKARTVLYNLINRVKRNNVEMIIVKDIFQLSTNVTKLTEMKRLFDEMDVTVEYLHSINAAIEQKLGFIK